MKHREATPQEILLFEALRDRQLHGAKFRRQAVILNRFIADFYCHKSRLIIELDGSVHDLAEQKAHDEERQAILEGQGYRVLRIPNDDIDGNFPAVLDHIGAHLGKRR